MSELDKTIEELEAEVLAELEEASQPSDSGGKADAPKKVKDEVNDEEDLGGAEPDAKVDEVEADLEEVLVNLMLLRSSQLLTNQKKVKLFQKQR